MENLASRIKRANSQVDNKAYRKAFSTIYADGRNILSKSELAKLDIVEKAMDNENMDFWSACARMESCINAEEDRIEKAMKSDRVKRFIADYKDFRSGYSMGERVIIIIETQHCRRCEVIADREQIYSGMAKKYNSSITYGKAELVVNLTGSRAKFTENIIKK